MRAAYISTFFMKFVYTECTSLVRGADDDALLRRFPVGRLCFKTEGAGKRRVFAIQNAFKQALLRPCHDWCMSVVKLIPMDGTFNNIKPIHRRSRLKTLFSYDLSSATDRFPLEFKRRFVESLFGPCMADAWVTCGLGIKKCIPCTIKSAWRSYCCQVCNRAAFRVPPLLLATIRIIPPFVGVDCGRTRLPWCSLSALRTFG